MRASTGLAGLVVVALVACGGAEDRSTPTTERPADSSVVALCDEPLPAPGEYEGVSETALATGGTYLRPYTVVVPESIDPTVPAPIYLHLASGGGSRDGFLQGWRAHYANTDVPGLMIVVDTVRGKSTEALLTLIDQVSGEFCVDASRVHVLGTSSSAGLAVDLACDAADRVASYSSGFGPGGLRQGCDPARPVPLLAFTGDTDRSADAAMVAAWAELNSCDPEPAIEELGSGVSHVVYEGCNAAVEFFDIEGMGHAWPMHDCLGSASYCAEYEEVDYLEEALRFFEENPLP